jgi:putative FmdB family regulatory protein
MPLYEFVCPQCQTKSEIITKSLEFQTPTCPKCLAPTKRILSPALIKGPFRWYKSTDYGRAGR